MGSKNKKKKDISQQKESVKSDEVTQKIDNEELAATADLAECKKSYRKRKKHYFNAIRKQMEFYFGDANLTKDRFLRKLIDKDPYVPLDLFLTFNKIKCLAACVEDIVKSLHKSDLLELDGTQQKVRRKTPLPEDRNVDEKTLYVEALPPNADHEWVRGVFERFGNVTYVSLPRYAKSRKIKEFGFIEFEKEKSVRRAVKAFAEFNGVLCALEKDPAELASVRAYLREQESEKDITEHTTETSQQGNCRKRRASEGLNDDSEVKTKKVKYESVDENVASVSVTSQQSSLKTENSSIVTDEEFKEPNETNQKKKSRRKKNKSKIAEKLKIQAELSTDVAYYELKILPKRDWKRLRNKYLNLQRESVAELKRKAWREQQELKHQLRDTNNEDSNSQLMTQPSPHKIVKTPDHKLQRMNMNFYGAGEDEAKTSSGLSKLPLFSYEPGLIVEITLLEPCVSVKEFKAEMRQHSSVKYVDIKEGATQAYLRLDSPNGALDFVQQIACAEYQCKILGGDAEMEYWRKIEKDRAQKLKKLIKIPQKRGREKIKKLINKHLRFEDDDNEDGDNYARED
uniref:La-related protein 7 n=1 Tax=Glossina morsitans morsitans TaxID=37546 RepID=A0A1B0FQW8_GLOMM